MNWMNGLCMLIGLGIGMEIMWCVMKYRYDSVTDSINNLCRQLIAALATNDRIIKGWGKSVELNGEILERNRELITIIEKVIEVEKEREA